MDPNELRISWRPLDEPFRCTGRLLSGKDHEFVYRGALRVEWDSPEGLFTYLSPHHDDPGEDAYDELRPLLARIIQEQYEMALSAA